jgi:hypothetical protein
MSHYKFGEQKGMHNLEHTFPDLPLCDGRRPWRPYQVASGTPFSTFNLLRALTIRDLDSRRRTSSQGDWTFTAILLCEMTHNQRVRLQLIAYGIRSLLL